MAISGIPDKKEKVFKYKVSDTGLAFHNSRKKIRGIMGPFGSGKSTMCVEDLLFIAFRQEPADDDVRYIRIGILRASYPLLSTTTKRSVEEVFPEQCGRIKETTPMTGTYRIPLPDGTRANIEIIMLAVEEEKDVKKLRSLNLTCIWISEPTEVASDILGAAVERIGRFPSGAYGKVTWSGIIMEFNKPPVGHWLDLLMKNPPSNMEFFIQPPAMFKRETDNGYYYEANPDAENLENLDGGVAYYYNQVELKRADGKAHEIDSLLCLLDSDSKDGKPVWENFSRDIHVTHGEVTPEPYTETVAGMDTSGIHPAVVFSQFLQGSWVVTDELYGEGMGLDAFIKEGLIPLARLRYGTCKIIISCDPANARDSFTGVAPTAHLEAAGFEVYLPKTNKPKLRINAVEKLFNMVRGGLKIGKQCVLLIAACVGGYKYPKKKLAGTLEITHSSTPLKNKDAHVADALQYLALYIVGEEEESEDDEAVRAQMAKNIKAHRRVM